MLNTTVAVRFFAKPAIPAFGCLWPGLFACIAHRLTKCNRHAGPGHGAQPVAIQLFRFLRPLGHPAQPGHIPQLAQAVLWECSQLPGTRLTKAAPGSKSTFLSVTPTSAGVPIAAGQARAGVQQPMGWSVFQKCDGACSAYAVKWRPNVSALGQCPFMASAWMPIRAGEPLWDPSGPPPRPGTCQIQHPPVPRR